MTGQPAEIVAGVDFRRNPRAGRGLDPVDRVIYGEAMINGIVEKWHEVVTAAEPAVAAKLLDELLAEDAVFYSPVVFKPQQGKAITTMYLLAAAGILAGPENDFKYTKRILDGDSAVLEFETTLDGKYVNGVDMITGNDAGQITEFKVMIRPLQAINAVFDKMRAALESAS